MIIEIHKKIETDLRNQIIIIGSGPTGLSLALKLSHLGKKVTILESGLKSQSSFHRKLNKGENSGELFLDLQNSRARCFGGSSVLWAGVCRPLEKNDFRQNDKRIGAGWPINFEELLPYYIEAGNFLGLDNKLFHEAKWWKLFKLGAHFDAFKEHNSKITGKYYTRLDTDKRNFNIRFFEKVKNNKNINVILDATVVDAKFTKNELKALIVKNSEGVDFKFNVSTVVMACGSLENARLLLNLKETNPSSPLMNHEKIGKSFMSHPGIVNVGKVLLGDKENCVEKTKNSNDLDRLVLALSEQVISEKGLLSHNISLSSNETETINSLRQFKDKSLARGSVSMKDIKFLINSIEPSKMIQSVFCSFEGSDKKELEWEFGISMEQLPTGGSFLSLSSEKDDFGLKQINMNWAKIPKEEQNSAFEIAKQFGIEFARKNVGRVKLNESFLQGDSFKINDPINHHIGTTCMAKSIKDGVVDENCKVFDVNNLYVVGGSVFSTSGAVNPTFTMIALSLRLADHLKKIN